MANESSTRQVVVFTLGGGEYALPIQQIQEIIRYQEPRSVASEDPYVRGVLSLRGRIIPVYDIAPRLGASAQIGSDGQIIIVDTGPETVGVIVEGVDQVLTVDDDKVENAPSADTTVIDGIIKIDERLVVLLAPAALFGGELRAAAV